MPSRFHLEGQLLDANLAIALPEDVSRHIQVLRLQPGDAVQLFDGHGSEWLATVSEMGRKVVTVVTQHPVQNDREIGALVTLAIGMPANDRMDFVVEKATELGVHAIQPLICERSVLRLDGERAAKKVAHWRGVASAAAEQCGRSVVPDIHPVQHLATWLKTECRTTDDGNRLRGVLSLREAQALPQWVEQAKAQAPSDDSNSSTPHFIFLNGPEGGLSENEELGAIAQGWQTVSLGRRTLRADTAPLTALTMIAARFERWER